MVKIVYHGSPNKDINILKANRSTHMQDAIYATDNKVVAMLFMGRGNGDLDTIKSLENGIPVLIERRPGILKKLYNKSGYIYELLGDSFKHLDYLWSPEVISFEKEIKPINQEYHENILKSLEQMRDNGLLKIYQYPLRPNYIPLDNSDLIDKYIQFEKQGIEGAIKSLLNVYPEFEEQINERMNNYSLDNKKSK